MVLAGKLIGTSHLETEGESTMSAIEVRELVAVDGCDRGASRATDRQTIDNAVPERLWRGLDPNQAWIFGSLGRVRGRTGQRMRRPPTRLSG